MPRPQVIVEARDWIANHLLLRRQEEGEVRKDLIQYAPLKISFARRPAPDVIAGIYRLHLGHDRGAHAGTDAVAANHDLAGRGTPARAKNAIVRALLAS